MLRKYNNNNHTGVCVCMRKPCKLLTVFPLLSLSLSHLQSSFLFSSCRVSFFCACSSVSYIRKSNRDLCIIGRERESPNGFLLFVYWYANDLYTCSNARWKSLCRVREVRERESENSQVRIQKNNIERWMENSHHFC